ncbi:MAG: hypothetical protein NC328_05975 [Muribaculum sp.]|nr:hypothetical protein [Muribaculum sp.]
MKKKGSTCEFNAERNAALKAAYRKALMDRRCKNLSDVFHQVARMGAPRFYVSEQRALTVVKHIKRTGEFPVMNATRRSLFGDIWRRFQCMSRAHPDMSDYDIVFEIVNSPAPSFYLTPRSVRTILYAIRN